METKTIPLTEAHAQLLEKRGISPEIADRLGWESCVGRSGDWISIPFYRAGKVVNHKYRTISGEKKFSQDKGGEQCFYNLDAVLCMTGWKPEDVRATQVVICEGEMDCAIALQCGYTAISVPNGAPDKPIEDEGSVKFDFLKDMPRQCIAVLAVDGDNAGQVLKQELALRLGWHRCKWIVYPKGCKDLNEAFVKYGKKGVDEILSKRAKFMSAGGLFSMDELPALPDIPAYPCGIGNLDDMIKIRPADLIVVTGISSMGKSLFANCLSATMARNYGWNACFFGGNEQNPQDDYRRFLRTFYLQKASKSAGGYPQWSDGETADADDWVKKYFSFILPDIESDELITLKWVMERAQAAITQRGARIIVIDPWNELDHDRPQGMSLTEYTGFAIKELKRLARRYMVTVVICAHPSKPEKDKDGGYAIPTLYDISDSAHWFNKADLGIVVHRLDGENDTYGTLVRVAKVRHWGINGRKGDKMLEYLPERCSYIDAPDFKPKSKKPKEKKGDPQAALPYKD